jgi:hypothetical protein
MNPNFSLVTELERLASALSADGEGGTNLSLQSVADRIAKSLGVKPDEVAIMGLSTRWKHLYFGAGGSSSSRVHPVVEQFGAGGSHGERKPAGN